MSNTNSTGLISRRVFLGGLGLTAAGLYFGVYSFRNSGRRSIEEFSALNPNDEANFKGLNPNVFIHVAPVTGLVSIVCHRSEMGQGVRSSIPVLMADELGADMAQVKIIQGEGNKLYGDQNTDGSSSVRGVYTELRIVAATARMMLVSAAAKKLGVPENELTAENNQVVHKSSGKTLSFGELSNDAQELPIPKPEEVKLRPEEELKRIGTKLPLLDGPDYVHGRAVFGADISLPKMLIAVIARPPVLGGKPKLFDKEAALKIPGVKQVIEMPHPAPPYAFQPFGGVAVLAENTWAAWKGRDALNVQWENPPEHEGYDSVAYKKSLLASVQEPGKVERKLGNVDEALKSAKTVLNAEYYVPHLPHLTMEPLAALAQYLPDNGGTCEVWAPTQNPQSAKTEVARILGIPEERVLVHVTLLGGGFGRKSKPDFLGEAVFLSKTTGLPIRVQWTRTDDIRNDYLNTVSAQKLTAGLDANGKVVAWRQRTAFPPIATTFNPAATTPGPGELQQGILDQTLSVPNIQFEACEAKPHVRIGWLRSVYNIFHAFATNSFVDEIAHARKKDPLENIIEIFGPEKIVSLEQLGVADLKNYGATLDDQPVDGERLLGVLKFACEKANWKGRSTSKSKAYGLATHRSFNAYAAVVVSVVPGQNGSHPLVDEVWIAIDAGKVINPDRVHSQLEGATLNGLNHLYYGGVTFKNGVAEQENFHNMQIVRNAVAPRKIHTFIVPSDKKHGGVGEPGVPPVAPAVTNAIFAMTGKRIREFNMNELFTS